MVWRSRSSPSGRLRDRITSGSRFLRGQMRCGNAEKAGGVGFARGT